MALNDSNELRGTKEIQTVLELARLYIVWVIDLSLFFYAQSIH